MSGISAFFYQPAAWLVVRGGDAADFLQGQFTNDLRAAMEDACVYGLWLDHRGKVQADGWILRESAEAFHVFSYTCPGALIRDRLESHIIADDVEVEESGPVEALSLYGPEASGMLGSAGLAPPEPGGFTRGGELRVFPGRRSARPSYELLPLGPGAGHDWRARVEEAVAKAQATLVSADQLQRERLAAGIPAVPGEIGPGDLPAEGGLVADAVSLTKGCFLGQEVVARMHHVGRARRVLCRITGSGPVPSTPVVLSRADGETAGELRSAVPDGPEQWMGMAMVKRRALGGSVEELLLPDGGAVKLRGEAGR